MTRHAGTSLVVSLLAHAACAGVLAWVLHATRTPHRRSEIPVELVSPAAAAPIPTPVPAPAPTPLPAAAQLPESPPPEATPEPTKSEPEPKQPEAKLDQQPAAPARPTKDTAPSRPAPKRPSATKKTPRPTTPKAPASKTASATKAKVAKVEPAPPPAPAKAARTAIDLAPFTPGGARLRLVIRIDRLRGSRWLNAVEALLEPMPDYRSVIAGTKLSLGEALDLLLISSPAPDDVEQTFVAAKTSRDDVTIRASLVGDPKKPRVTWEEVAGGIVGHRAKDTAYADDDQDPRVLLLPYPGWILLTRPEHVAKLLEPVPATAVPEEVGDGDAGAGGNGEAGAASNGDAGATAVTASRAAPELPRWLVHLSDIADEAQDGPILVLGFSELERQSIAVPSLPTLPAPSRGFVSLSMTTDGFIAAGWLAFGDAAIAKTFATDAEEARLQAIDSIGLRFLLKRVHAMGAMERLRFEQVGANVAFSTTIGADDAALMFEAAGTWSKDFFGSKRRPRKN